MVDLMNFNGRVLNKGIEKVRATSETIIKNLSPSHEYLTKTVHKKWLINDILQEDSMAMIHGPSGSGRTFIALDWMLHLATSQADWFGHKVHPCDVVYLCGEGHHGMYSRVAAWATEHNCKDFSKIYISRDSTDLDNPVKMQMVINEIKSTGLNPKFIVIDTLSCFFSKNENSAKDVRSFLNECENFRQLFGSSLLLVHITGVKSYAQNRGRGSSVWSTCMDQEFNIAPQINKGLILKQVKMRDGKKIEPMKLKLKTVTIPGWFDEDGESVTSVVLINANVTNYKQGQDPVSALEPSSSEGEKIEGGIE
ncbi:MAG: AAA family ATPase [Syntrophorhabdus sp.]